MINLPLRFKGWRKKGEGESPTGESLQKSSRQRVICGRIGNQ